MRYKAIVLGLLVGTFSVKNNKYFITLGKKVLLV